MQVKSRSSQTEQNIKPKFKTLNTVEIKKGWYKHFKGEVYQILGIAKHTETEEEFVLYIHITDSNPDGFWVRPVDMFLGYKELEDGTKVKRFEYVGETNPNGKLVGNGNAE